jgi:hypothetical protein
MGTRDRRSREQSRRDRDHNNQPRPRRDPLFALADSRPWFSGSKDGASVGTGSGMSVLGHDLVPDGRLINRARYRWTRSESNRRPPPCHGGALPIELRARGAMLAAPLSASSRARAPSAPAARALALGRAAPLVGAVGRDARRRGGLLPARPASFGSRPRRPFLSYLFDRDALAREGPLVGDLERDAVLLGILGNAPLRLKIADHRLERAPIRHRGEVRPLEPMTGAHELLRGARRGDAPVRPAAPPAGAARPRPLGACSGGRVLRGRRRPTTAPSPAPTSPSPRLAHLGPPTLPRSRSPGRRTTAARGRSTPAPQ